MMIDQAPVHELWTSIRCQLLRMVSELNIYASALALKVMNLEKLMKWNVILVFDCNIYLTVIFTEIYYLGLK